MVEARDLKKYFPVRMSFIEHLLLRKRQYVRAVDGVSFDIMPGEVFGLAGESGCGKTTTGRLLLRLIEPTAGEVYFDGVNILALDKREMKALRRHMQIIFQDPYASLNPRMKVGEAVKHALDVHGIGSEEERVEMALKALERVGLTPPEEFYDKYPHQLSGGQRQRVAIARAIVLNPRFIVADEPVSMLDVSVRGLILDLMMQLKREMGLTYLFITHDLAVAKQVCDRIAIMYLGKIVEIGDVSRVFSEPLHPYTAALLAALPSPSPRRRRGRRAAIGGEVPSPINPPPGCRFHPRCPYATERCREEEPRLEGDRRHAVACHRAGIASGEIA
ncbi:oligopeptide ABC transporter ATP-binding protein [Candidatus Geothermarchaeota archaeon ex4572_27]|nr:MAG: oligopeptide ABC transporter ATP-binding protein [Candidatus Geothermarchaeota archaeon ex4572_27]